MKYELKEGHHFKDDSELDHLKLASDISSIREISEGPLRFFKNVLTYLNARPSIAEDRGILNKEMASEFLTLTLLDNMISSDDRPGARKAFAKCMTNPKNMGLIEKFSKVVLESVEDGSGAIAGMEFSFDNRGNMTLKGGFATDDFSNEDLDGIVIDRHLDGSA
tara:strand:+ start:515 stop:1006 length:492 start_codon:yes stop_codon:yes gene_type:complete